MATVGQWVVVAGTEGDGLNARYTPGGRIRTTVRDGYRIKITARRQQGGRWWVRGDTYWYAEEFVKPEKAAGGGGGSGTRRVSSPCPGYRVTTPFGKRPNDSSYWQARGHHTGDDYAAPAGADVVAVLDGTAKLINDSVLGSIVLLYADNGYTYWYCHLSNRRVRSGQKVKAGQHLGDVGQSGSGARGNHLHFEKRKGHTTSWGGKDLKPTW